MNFSELEKIMLTRGITALAEIARYLKTTPQAVSNWKTRDQVPHHIVGKLNSHLGDKNVFLPNKSSEFQYQQSSVSLQQRSEDNMVSFSDLLLTAAEQLKIILLTTFISIFLTFTYVMFIKAPQYVSSATVLIPSGGSSNLGGLSGLASQFGVNMPTGSDTDLSSPSLFPELLRSRVFAEKLLEKKFYTKKYQKELTLLAILTNGDSPAKVGKDTLVSRAIGPLGQILAFEPNVSNSFSIIKVTASEPLFSKALAEEVLLELEALNRFYKTQTVNEKISFISSRIASVEKDLKSSENSLKEFNERNRQISSPALQLDQSRLAGEVEIQKGIYLTLKQQLELSKIEEVQETSVFQILDPPQVPLGPINKKIKLNLFFATIFGLFAGLTIGFIRAYTNSANVDEKKKLRRIKHFIKKKTKGIVLDYRISGIISMLLIICLPYYLEHESKIPVFFGKYSSALMMVIVLYVFVLISSFLSFIYLFRGKK